VIEALCLNMLVIYDLKLTGITHMIDDYGIDYQDTALVSNLLSNNQLFNNKIKEINSYLKRFTSNHYIKSIFDV